MRIDAKHADIRMRKRLGKIVSHLKAMDAAHIAKNDDLDHNISNQISAQYLGGSVTLKRVREVVNDLSLRSQNAPQNFQRKKQNFFGRFWNILFFPKTAPLKG